MSGMVIGVMGIALCLILCCAGSTVGLYYTGQAASGVLAEDSKKFSKLLILVMLPATCGIYGFVLAVLGINSLSTDMTLSAGWTIFGAMMPLAVVAFLGGIFQGKCCVASIYAVAKNESLSGKLLLFPAMIETYAILSLVVSILLLQ